MIRALASHLVAFGLGAIALRILQERELYKEQQAEQAAEEEDDESEEEEEEDEPDEKDRRLRLNGHAVRDDYPEAQEPYKMLLICNMELYKVRASPRP